MPRRSATELSVEAGCWVVGFRVYLNPKSMYNNSPKHVIIAIKAIILHIFGVQVGFRVGVCVESRP